MRRRITRYEYKDGGLRAESKGGGGGKGYSRVSREVELVIQVPQIGHA